VDRAIKGMAISQSENIQLSMLPDISTPMPAEAIDL
jgi:hypothetical protein